MDITLKDVGGIKDELDVIKEAINL